MAIQQEIGDKGENLAALYLQKLGYDVLEQNYRTGRLEVDLICKKGDVLVFVEVKTRSSTKFGNPETFVNSAKASKIIEAAETYMYNTNWEGSIRFDIVSVLLIKGENQLEHFKDAFY